MGSEASDLVDETIDNYRQMKNQEYRDYWAVRGNQDYNPDTQVTLSATKRDQLKDV